MLRTTQKELRFNMHKMTMFIVLMCVGVISSCGGDDMDMDSPERFGTQTEALTTQSTCGPIIGTCKETIMTLIPNICPPGKTYYRYLKINMCSYFGQARTCGTIGQVDECLVAPVWNCPGSSC